MHTVLALNTSRKYRFMLILRKLVFTLLTFSTALYLLHPSDAEATYWFNVKLDNFSGDSIKITEVKVKAKNGSRKSCHSAKNRVVKNGTSTLKPRCPASAQKWQRQIRVSFYCDYGRLGTNGAYRTLNFPRGAKKFFARDHAQKNGDKYVVRIKTSDC